MNIMRNARFLKIYISVWYAFSLGLLVWETWRHEITLSVIQALVLIVASVLLGHAWWPRKEVEMHTLRVPMPPEYPADKDSHNYKMGYEDGKADAQSLEKVPVGTPFDWDDMGPYP